MNEIKEFYSRPMSDREIRLRAASVAITGLVAGVAWLVGLPDVAEVIGWTFVYFCAFTAARLVLSRQKARRESPEAP